MKNSIIEKKLITFIKNNSAYPGLYWVPLTKQKNKLPVKYIRAMILIYCVR